MAITLQAVPKLLVIKHDLSLCGCVHHLPFALPYTQAQFWGNKAHSGLIGLVVLGLPAECTAIGGFTSYSNWDYGIFSSTASRLAVTDCTIASGKIGLNLNIFGPDPVAHRLGRKWIKIEKTLIVGLVEDEECISSVPAHAPRVSQSAREHKLGIMMSSFNKKRSKMDGTGAWHKSMFLLLTVNVGLLDM